LSDEEISRLEDPESSWEELDSIIKKNLSILKWSDLHDLEVRQFLEEFELYFRPIWQDKLEEKLRLEEEASI
jgi:hypothetical protein